MPISKTTFRFGQEHQFFQNFKEPSFVLRTHQSFQVARKLLMKDQFFQELLSIFQTDSRFLGITKMYRTYPKFLGASKKCFRTNPKTSEDNQNFTNRPNYIFRRTFISQAKNIRRSKFSKFFVTLVR